MSSEVTQADRNAAANLAHAIGETWEEAKRIRKGEREGFSEDFARHRIEATRQLEADKAELVEELELALRAPNWAESLEHVHNAIALRANQRNEVYEE